MALVRCKSCGIDTSDSLERCPNCGRSPAGLSLASAVAVATEAANQATKTGAGSAASAQALKELSPKLRSVPRIVWIVAVLVILAVVPHAFPILAVLAILWMLSRGRQVSRTRERNVESEVLKILKSRTPPVRRAAANRPLERLRAAEQRTLKRDV